jgi:hypothetical protein
MLVASLVSSTGDHGETGTHAPRWRPVKELGERDIIKRIHGALPQPGDWSRYLVVDGKSEIEPIEGVLRRKALHDELRGDMYGVIEDAHGQAHYVPLDSAAVERP